MPHICASPSATMRLFFLLPLIALLSCNPSPSNKSTSEPEEYVQPSHHTEQLSKVFEAHGGYERWAKMKSLTYMKGEEKTITNLQNRKIRLESPEKIIGYDGNQVWVSPDSISTDRIRFYHNLYFYFFAMPFVVGDNGVFYEELPAKELNGKSYLGIKISYDDGIGDAPDDNYIIWYDPETNLMEWLMYTVTYSSGEPSNQYSLIKYGEWKTFNGLLLPTLLQWHQYDGEMVGEPRGEGTSFSDVVISKNTPDEALFEMPEGAVVAPR